MICVAYIQYTTYDIEKLMLNDKEKCIIITLTTLSLPTVSNLFLVSSKNIYDTVCLTSWNVAKGARLKCKNMKIL